MLVFSRAQKRSNQWNYFDEVNAHECDSTLEVPDGRNPRQNAWLTITINYTLEFVDRNNLANLGYLRNKKAYIRDSDRTEFPLRDWDYASQLDFKKRFDKGEGFWNYKFLLITPPDYDELDYTSMVGAGSVSRPNIICLFRLKAGASPTHLTIRAVRPEISGWDSFWGKSFRSHETLYQEGDVTTKTLWHELGHALDQLHIRALNGDAKCLVDINADRCYDGDNIMGRGTKLESVNAKPWRELIWHHTRIPQNKWVVTSAVDTPPRVIPLGVAQVAKPALF